MAYFVDHLSLGFVCLIDIVLFVNSFLRFRIMGSLSALERNELHGYVNNPVNE